MTERMQDRWEGRRRDNAKGVALSEPLSAEQRAQFRQRRDAAAKELAEVCSQGPHRRFRMTIPVNRNDTDVMIGDALREYRIVLDEIDRLSADNRDLRDRNRIGGQMQERCEELAAELETAREERDLLKTGCAPCPRCGKTYCTVQAAYSRSIDTSQELADMTRERDRLSARVAELEHKFQFQRGLVEAAHKEFHELVGPDESVRFQHSAEEEFDPAAQMRRIAAARDEARAAVDRLDDQGMKMAAEIEADNKALIALRAELQTARAAAFAECESRIDSLISELQAKADFGVLDQREVNGALKAKDALAAERHKGSK